MILRCTWISMAVLGAAAGARAATYAISIGYNAPPREQAEAPLAALQYADDDAVRFHQLFRRMNANAEILSVLDEATQRRYPEVAAVARAPSLESLRTLLGAWGPRMRQDVARGESVALFVTYSGHGARSPEGRMALTMLDGGITEAVLYDELLASLPATYTHLLIDACNAGAIVGARGGFDREADTTAVPLTGEEIAATSRAEQFPSVGVIVATTNGQQSHEWSEIEAGVFTHEVISALSGAADVNRDGRIEYSEVHAFVASANRDLEDPRAAPRIIAAPPLLNRRVPLVSLRDFGPVAYLTGKSGGLGAFHVELENGQRYLDAHLDPELETTITVPADTEVFIRTREREAQVRLAPSERRALASLALVERRSRSRGSVAWSFHADLFGSPYSESYYRGFTDSTAGFAVELEPGVGVRSGDEHTGVAAKGLLAAGGALLAASVVFGWFAYDAKQDFDATELQRPAHEAAARYRRHSGFAIAGAVLAAAAGAGAWWLWPAPTEQSAAAGLALNFALRF